MTQAARRQRPRQWTKRNAAPPRASFEELEIHTVDGVALRAVMDDPPEGVALAGTCVLGHAMFARKTSFGRRDRPGLAHALSAAGFRTIAFDFRGHGDSAAADYGYDDFVRFDLPAVVSAARARSEEQPVIVVGHSLGGHVALASQGASLLEADAIVGLAANVWHPELERSLVRRALKRVIASASVRAAARIGRVPARTLRLGSDDASLRYIDDLFRITRRATWASSDGAHDYLAGLANVTIPVANVVGDKDRLMCHPAAGEAFLLRCAGPTALFRAHAGHMDLVTSSRHHGVVIDAVRWAASAFLEATR
jgi:predicted alpha/beta hydrolase